MSSVLRPHQHSIGYTGDGFYVSNSVVSLFKTDKRSQ